MNDDKMANDPTRLPRWCRPVVLVMAFCFVAAACGSDAADSTGDQGGAAADERTVITADGADEGEVATTAEPAAEAPTTESTPADTTAADDSAGGDSDVPGEPLDFAPAAGTDLAVVGVAFDDTLNFRAEPSPDADVVTSVAPVVDGVGVSALGEAWAAPSGVWWKVDVDGSEAWANQAFLGGLGAPTDVFDDVAAELGVLMFDDVEAAALAVAETRVSGDVESRVVLVAEPLAFEVGGSAVVDVLDLADDSVKGERIRIGVDIVFDENSGEEGAQDVAFVVVTEVEITPICGRGVTDGLCV